MKSKTNSLNQSFLTKINLIVFLTMIIILTSCKDNKVSTHDKNSIEIEMPRIDVHTAVITDNRKVVKQHIEAGTDINEKRKWVVQHL